MRILLFGAKGQLGWELLRSTAPLGILVPLDYPQVDFRRVDSLSQSVRAADPQIILNAAAYTAVDQAESEPENAMAVNAEAPGVLAELSKQLGALLIHYSTDYVFDGAAGIPYQEGDLPNPVNMYGKSKWLGERSVAQVNPAHLVLRTSWVYSMRRDSFVTKVLTMARRQEDIHIVTDQIGSPTWARMLAEATAQLLAAAKASRDPIRWLGERTGLYHLAGWGFASRFEWAQAVLSHAFAGQELNPVALLPASTDQFPTPARRPLFTALDCRKFESTFNLRLPDWELALQLAMEDLVF